MWLMNKKKCNFSPMTERKTQGNSRTVSGLSASRARGDRVQIKKKPGPPVPPRQTPYTRVGIQPHPPQQTRLNVPEMGAPAYLKQCSFPRSPNPAQALRGVAPMVPGYSYQVSSKPYRPGVDRDSSLSVGTNNNINVIQNGPSDSKVGHKQFMGNRERHHEDRSVGSVPSRQGNMPRATDNKPDSRDNNNRQDGHFGSIPEYLCDLPELSRWSMSFGEKHRSVGILEMRSPGMRRDQGTDDAKRHSVGYFEESRLNQPKSDAYGKLTKPVSHQQSCTIASIEQLKKSMEDLVNTIADSQQSLPGRKDPSVPFRDYKSDSVLPRKPPSPVDADSQNQFSDTNTVAGKN